MYKELLESDTADYQILLRVPHDVFVELLTANAKPDNKHEVSCEVPIVVLMSAAAERMYALKNDVTNPPGTAKIAGTSRAFLWQFFFPYRRLDVCL